MQGKPPEEVHLEEEMMEESELNPQPDAMAPSNIHDSIINGYFHIPENSLFLDYWNRVEDRLYKIRQSLNIMGIKQPLPLFQPPIDPMAIVQAVGSGASLSQALAGGSVQVPHYRFMFMLNKAKELCPKA